jgi:hypothetical protein
LSHKLYCSLGDVISTETIITEEAEWNPEKQHSDCYLNMVPKWKYIVQQEGLDVIIVNPGVIIGPDFQIKEAAIIKKSSWWLVLLYIGTTGFIVTDVVQ